MKLVKFIVLGFCLVSFLNVNIAVAKDLYVSPSGDDNITYAANNISNPWQSVAHAFANVQAGDNVYFRAGTYTISSQIVTKYNANGTVSQPITFSNYNDENVEFSASFSTGVGGAVQIDRDYYSISGIDFTATGTFWYVGNSLSSDHFTVSDGHCSLTQDGGGSNVACVRYNSTRSNYGRVENLVMQGPGRGANINTAAILVFRSQGVKILNNEIYNFPKGIYYKHTCIPSDTGTEYAYNYFHDNGIPVSDVSQYTNIHDNLFVGGIYKTGQDGGTGDDGSNAGSDHNNIHHNTFYNCTLVLTRSTSNDGSGAQYNNIKDNIFTSYAAIFQYNSVPHYSTMDWNLYDPVTAVINARVNYSSLSWRSYYGQDSSSIAGDAVLVGGESPSAITDYGLTSSSPGYWAASDGKNIGADVSLVGVKASGSDPVDGNNAPIMPLIANVEIVDDISSQNLIFKDNFEDQMLMSQKYVYYNDHNGDCAVIDGAGLGGSRGIRAKWEDGQVDAGSFWYMFGRNPVASQSHSDTDFNDIYWRFYMKTSDGWMGNPHKLTRVTIFARSDWSQAMIAHLWGEAGDVVMKMDPATGIDGDQLTTSEYNDTADMRWLGMEKGTTSVYDPSMSGVWYCVEVHAKLNTPGNSNGVFEFWIDGNLEARRDDLNWIGSWQGFGINAILFGNYWNSGAPQAQQRFMDNIVVSTEHIGLAPSPVNPIIYKTAFKDPDPDDIQGVFEAQVSATSDTSGIVWTGGISGNADNLRVNTSTGSFQGALSGVTSLSQATTYFTRARQADDSGKYSDWSPWKIFRTEGSGVPGTPPWFE